MTSFDPPSWIRHLGFHYFLKGQEIKEINTKANQNAYEMHKFMKFWYLREKMEKNYRII